MTFLFYKNNGTYGVANISAQEIIESTPTQALIKELDATGIIISHLLVDPAITIDYLIWLNHRTGRISLEQSGYSIFNGEMIIEDAEEFRIKSSEVNALLSFLS